MVIVYGSDLFTVLNFLNCVRKPITETISIHCQTDTVHESMENHKLDRPLLVLHQILRAA